MLIINTNLSITLIGISVAILNGKVLSSAYNSGFNPANLRAKIVGNDNLNFQNI
jgi:hypothetical protein